MPNAPFLLEQHTNYNGGMLSPTFLTGGYLPAPVRGTSTNVTVHIADWYATFAVLAGADPRDDPPVVPLPVDPALPELDIYQGNLSYPPSDSVNVWPFLVDPTQASNWSAAHPDGVVLSAEVLVQVRETIEGREPVKPASRLRAMKSLPVSASRPDPTRTHARPL